MLLQGTGVEHAEKSLKEPDIWPLELEDELLVFDCYMHTSDSEMLVLLSKWQDFAILVMSNSWLLFGR